MALAAIVCKFETNQIGYNPLKYLLSKRFLKFVLRTAQSKTNVISRDVWKIGVTSSRAQGEGIYVSSTTTIPTENAR